MKGLKDVVIKTLIEKKSIIIVEIVKYKQGNRRKITTYISYENTSICMNCKETETKTFIQNIIRRRLSVIFVYRKNIIFSNGVYQLLKILLPDF